MIHNGYGQTLEVDLSTDEIIIRDTDLEFAEQYIGGMGFGSKILYDEVGYNVDPLSPANIVVFANGPLTGTHTPCSGRTEITTKSTLTDSIGTGNTGGLWGAKLKHAGFDLIVIMGQAKEPKYIWIDNDKVEIRKANHIWGKDTRTTSDTVKKELGSSSTSEISVLAIGPAGENLVKFACPLNDYHHVSARNSAGAVLGSKKLKAIAVRGTGSIRIARPKEFQEAVKEAREQLLAASKAAKLIDRDPRKNAVKLGCLPAKNYQTGILPDWLKNRGVEAAQRYDMRKVGTCYACPVSCFNLAEVNEGKYAGLQVNRATMPGAVFDWGAKCAIDNLPAIWKCKEICQHFCMDYASAAGVIAFAMELFQRGIISIKDTDGLELTWGNEDAVIEMLNKIALRDGFGDILAEGSAKAARIIGKGAEQYVMTTKGMEIMNEDPRTARRGWLFGDLTNPRGGDNVKGTHFFADMYNPNWWTDKFDMFNDVKRQIYYMPPEEVSFTWEGKPMMTKWFEDLYSTLNTLGLCFFPSGFHLALGPTHLSRLYSACTGWDKTPQQMMQLGEKVFNLLKAYTVRQGMTKKNDTWPDRFYTEPLPEGPGTGRILSREEITRLIEEYYQLRGWDKETGLPTREKLTELELVDVADDLMKIGKLP